MAKIESEIKITLTSEENNNLKNAIKKLTEVKIGFQKPDLTKEEEEIINYLKTN
jgi:hypothetical protein